MKRTSLLVGLGIILVWTFLSCRAPATLAIQPQVAAGAYHTVGLKSDGTVVAVGNNLFGQLNVGDWSDIVQVAAGYWHTVGLKSDGTVVGAGVNDRGQLNLSGWSDIVQLAAGGLVTVGLKSDDTVVAVGEDAYGELDVGGWSDIVQVAAGDWHTVGLKSDGTVVAVGEDAYGQLDVGGWSDIVQVAAGYGHTVGLKSDGAAVAVGLTVANSFIIPGWHLWSMIPSPTTFRVISLPVSDSAVIDSDPEKAAPIGIGPLASGGDTFRLEIKLEAFEAPVDLYFGIFLADVDPLDMCILKPDLTFQTHQDGIIPWKTNISGSISETLFGEIPVSALPASKYYVYLAATQAGKDFSSGYYLWSIQFEIGAGGAPRWWQIFAFPVINDGCVCDFLWPKSLSRPR